MQTASFTCSNGLGDKFLDVLGVHVLCDYLGLTPKIEFNKSHIEHFDWGTNVYDLRLFSDIPAFKDSSLFSTDKFRFHVPNPSSSLCPYKVYEFLQQYGINEITFSQINAKYREVAKKLIRPSKAIEDRLLPVLKNTYGIHLRKTDKIKSTGCDKRHENKVDEFSIIIENLLDETRKIIEEEAEPSFLVVSEDKEWKKTITEFIEEYATQIGKKIQIVVLDYSNPDGYINFESVLDMFALSKCKNIIQGVKYSTFSILAALIGQGKLINYSYKLESNDVCLIYSWNSVVEINGEYIDNIEIQSFMTSSIQDPNIIPI